MCGLLKNLLQFPLQNKEENEVVYLNYSGPNNISVAAGQSFDSVQAEAVAALLDSCVSSHSAVHLIETKVSKKLDRNRRGG